MFIPLATDLTMTQAKRRFAAMGPRLRIEHGDFFRFP